MVQRGQGGFTRRQAITTMSGLALGLAGGRAALAQDASPAATPGATPETGEWTYTDVLGKTVTLPARPVRIAANLVTAAAIWDLGIRPVAVFDWTTSAYPDGDHIAWGNVDPSAVVNVGDVNGNILPEELLNVRPDVILTLTFDSSDPSGTAGVDPGLAGPIEEIAPVIVATDMASTEVQLARLIDLAERLGADVNAPAVIEAKTAYEAKLDEFREVAAAKSDLTSLFLNVDADALYVAGPQGVAELQFLGSLGMQFANADSAEAGAFWETLSAEQALLYPSDIVYNDVYSAYQGVDELQAQSVYGAMPAIAAGQVGEWPRDFPVNYAGVADFLDVILATLRTAEKVTG